MGDAFNPQEILARLRAKPVHSSTSSALSGNTQAKSSIAAAAAAAAVPSSGSSIGSSNNNSVAAANAASKFLRSNPAQHPYVNDASQQARQELEREIVKLQQENAHLKAENKQLKHDKDDIARHFLEYKTKSDETIAKLRGKISKLVMVDAPLPAALGGPSHTNTALSATKLDGSGTGKLYPRQAPANTSLVVNTSPTAAAKGREGRSTSPVKARGPTALNTSTSTVEGGAEESFMEPTFSERMRRSTQDPVDFAESLRRARGGNGHTNGHVFLDKPHAASIQERSQVLDASSGGKLAQSLRNSQQSSRGAAAGGGASSNGAAMGAMSSSSAAAGGANSGGYGGVGGGYDAQHLGGLSGSMLTSADLSTAAVASPAYGGFNGGNAMAGGNAAMNGANGGPGGQGNVGGVGPSGEMKAYGEPTDGYYYPHHPHGAHGYGQYYDGGDGPVGVTTHQPFSSGGGGGRLGGPGMMMAPPPPANMMAMGAGGGMPPMPSSSPAATHMLRRTTSAPPMSMSMFHPHGLFPPSGGAVNGNGGMVGHGPNGGPSTVGGGVDDYYGAGGALPVLEVDLTR